MIADSKNREKYAKALQANILFKDVPVSSFEMLLNDFKEEKWTRHTCILSPDKTLHRFHAIISGRVKMFQSDPDTGREFTLFLLTKTDSFDVLCLLEATSHSVYYEALDDVVVLSTPIEKMREWIQLFPEINRNLLPYLGKQIRMLEEYASNITFTDISRRLAGLILKNLNSKNELELINDLSNEELAKLIGSTRAVVNRHLQEFKTDGILKLGRKKMEIKNLQLLLEKFDKQK